MNTFIPPTSARRASSRRKRQQDILIILQGAMLSFICMCITGLALYLTGFNPLVFPFQLTATAVAARNASCQVLIDRAIQASGNYCGGTNSNNVCYGNTTIKAELVPNATQRFSERGDIITVNELRRLSAAPLNLENDEWGIAVFKVIANLPRSLPGETVTMIVFGNTTLGNQSGNMESFYFYSELGQIACEAVPFDGLMINTPDGGGTRIHVNGTELTLMGTASLRAVPNGEMEVSLFRGWGRIVSNGQEQYFGAGQKVSVSLGGENGIEATSGPSAPEPLTQQELNTACSVTGQYCAPGEVIPVSGAEAQQQFQNAMTFTPTSILTSTSTITPSPTLTPTSTTFVLPSWTPRQTATPTRTRTLIPTSTRTRTATPTRTRTATLPVARTNTPTVTITGTLSITPTVTTTGTATVTSTATSTATGTNTATATVTSTSTATSTATATATITQTSTSTATSTVTPIAPSQGICSSISLSPLSASGTDIGTVITNNGPPVNINRMFIYWVKSQTSQKLSKLFLDGTLVWNVSDPNTPSDIPSEGGFVSGADLQMPGGLPRGLTIQFQQSLGSGQYEVHVVFDSNCQVIGSTNIP